jgi:hypothetical protein
LSEQHSVKPVVDLGRRLVQYPVAVGVGALLGGTLALPPGAPASERSTRAATQVCAAAAGGGIAPLDGLGAQQPTALATAGGAATLSVHWGRSQDANVAAKANGSRCEKLACLAHLTPDHVTSSAMGGIALTFARGRRLAMIECDNDGDILAMLSDRSTDGDAHVWQVDATDEGLRGALAMIADFINGGGRAGA